MKRLVALFAMVVIISTTPVLAAQLNLTYDANGNLVTGDGKYRVYNSLNQLWKIYNGSSVNGTILETYVYHPTEERVWEKIIYNSSGNVSSTTYYFDQNHVRVVNSSGTYNFVYIYQNGDPVAQTLNGVTYFIHTDNKGSTSVVTNATGGVVERDNYDPYGNPLNNSIVRYGYESKETDSVLGDTDFNARRYTPTFGQFQQPDTLLPNVYDPQLLNRFMFERGNPLSNTDPTGRFLIYFGITGAAGAGGVAGASTGRVIDISMRGIETADYTRTYSGGGTPILSAGVEVGVSPFGHMNDFAGTSYEGSGVGGEGEAAGAGFFTPQNSEGKPQLIKSGISFNYNYVNINVNVLPIAVQGGQAKTSLSNRNSIVSFGGRLGGSSVKLYTQQISSNGKTFTIMASAGYIKKYYEAIGSNSPSTGTVKK